jgi:hypothetical protein
MCVTAEKQPTSIFHWIKVYVNYTWIAREQIVNFKTLYLILMFMEGVMLDLTVYF